MKKLLLAPALGLIACASLAACSGGPAPAPGPTATATAPATVSANDPTVKAAPTGVPQGRDDGKSIPADQFAAPVLKAAPDLAKVYTKPEMVTVATNACKSLRYGGLESDVVQNIRASALAKATAAGVKTGGLVPQIDTLIDSGLRSYCPEFQFGGDGQPSATLKATARANPTATKPSAAPSK